MGSRAVEGKAFEAIVEWLGKNFETVHFILADTLQRHSLGDELSEQERYSKAKKLGDEWLMRNQAVINGMSITTTLTHWDEWLRHPRYQLFHQLLEKLYVANDEFKGAILSDVYAYHQRKGKEKASAAEVKRGADYFLEELSCMAIFGEELSFVEVYPSSQIASTLYFIEREPVSGLQSLHSVEYIHLRLESALYKTTGAHPLC